MFCLPSWEALYSHLAAQQLELKDFSGYAKLIQYGHQQRENIASHPLKIIAISIIFCGNLQ
jgi:hypothetical protein